MEKAGAFESLQRRLSTPAVEIQNCEEKKGIPGGDQDPTLRAAFSKCTLRRKESPNIAGEDLELRIGLIILF